MYLSSDFLANAFDFLVVCYMYGCLTCICLLFIGQTYSTLSNCDRSKSVIQLDFYNEVKELLNPTEELVLESSPTSCFDSLTIRELRAYIKDNQLHYQVRDRLSKSVSVAHKSELVACLNSL